MVIINVEIPDSEFCDTCELRLDNRCALLSLSLVRTKKDAYQVGLRATEYHWIKNAKCPSLRSE